MVEQWLPVGLCWYNSLWSFLKLTFSLHRILWMGNSTDLWQKALTAQMGHRHICFRKDLVILWFSLPFVQVGFPIKKIISHCGDIAEPHLCRFIYGSNCSIASNLLWSNVFMSTSLQVWWTIKAKLCSHRSTQRFALTMSLHSAS